MALQFVTEVAPPDLVSVVKHKARNLLETINEEEEKDDVESMEDAEEEASALMTPGGFGRQGMWGDDKEFALFFSCL